MTDENKKESALAKVEPLVASDRLTGVVVDSSAKEFTQHTHTLADMTETYANAQIEVARSTFAVPAIEQTKRARESSYRFYVTCVVVLVLAFGIVRPKLEGEWLAVAIVGLVGALGAWGAVSSLKKDKPPHE